MIYHELKNLNNTTLHKNLSDDTIIKIALIKVLYIHRFHLISFLNNFIALHLQINKFILIVNNQTTIYFYKIHNYIIVSILGWKQNY